MTIHSDDTEFTAYIVDLMQSIGPVSAKRMFGGHGIFLDGLMFALIADATLYLKADAETEEDFKVRGLERFTYYKKDKPFSLSYYKAPEEILDHADDMSPWAAKAFDAALRAARHKAKKTKRPDA